MTLPRAATCVLLCLLVSCATETEHTPTIGEAYVGPTTLNIRKDLAAKAPTSAAVKHGDKLEILEYRYRLARVRTVAGAEGWVDLRQLLTPEQMAGLRHMAESASKAPAQGAATVYDAVNMHSQPNRSSPSFWQIQENAKVDVIDHKLTPRMQTAPAAPKVQPSKSNAQRRKSKERAPVRIGPPPPPPAPKPPANWLALSVPKAGPVEPAKTEPPKPAAAVPMDDWSLVRTSEGKAGWVLTSRLSMAIPDEVAQYAEGHRITSYFPLGQVQEGDSVKNNWLWTTITKGLQPYEFDSFRVFVWSHKHHRYETAYIERKVIGHYPIVVNTSAAGPSFSLIFEGDNGSLIRKTYSFEGFRIRMVRKEPYVAPVEGSTPKAAASAPVEQQRQTPSWFSRLKDRVKHLFH